MLGTVHRYTIPNYRPTTTNQLLSTHHMARSKLKRSDYEAVYLHGKHLPQADGKRRVSLIVTLGPRQRAPDPDAIWKTLLDGLKHARLLKNDSHIWCELGSVEFVRGQKPALEIILEDLE